MLSLWIFLDIVMFYLILMVMLVHTSRSGTEMLWSCCGESDGMWWGLSGTLDMDIGCGSLVHNDHNGRNINDCFGQRHSSTKHHCFKHSAAHALMFPSEGCIGSGHICCESTAQQVNCNSSTDVVSQNLHSASINGSICHPELVVVYERC